MQVLKVVKKGKNDVTIHCDDDKFMILTVEVFLKSGLKKGDDISEDRFSFLIEQNKLFHIKQKAFRILGRRQHSSFELRRKLWNKDYDKKLIDEVISNLERNGYLDDKEFIHVFVAEKIKSKKWSLKKIKSELFKKGIESKLIDEIISEQSTDSEYENALVLGKKKYEILLKRNLESRALLNKLSAYLISRGFDYDLIKKVCDKLMKINFDEN